MTFPSTPTTGGLSLLPFAHLILSLPPLSFALFAIIVVLAQSTHSGSNKTSLPRLAVLRPPSVTKQNITQRLCHLGVVLLPTLRFLLDLSRKAESEISISVH